MSSALFARACQGLCALFLTFGAASSAQATVVTWYVAGHLLADNNGTALDPRLADLGSTSSFSGSFSFNTLSSGLNLLPGRWDYVSSTAQGGQVSLQIGSYSYQSSSSRLITIDLAAFGLSGEQVALNGNGPMSGGTPGGLGAPGLDLLSMSASGSYPWFVPGHKPSTLPALNQASSPAMLDIYYFDPTSGDYVHRFGLVSALSLQPVPEAPSAALLGVGLLAIAWRRARSFRR